MTNMAVSSRYVGPSAKGFARRFRIAVASLAILVFSPVGGWACGAKVVSTAMDTIDSNMDTLIAAGVSITLGFNEVIDSLTKLANQGSNNGQNLIQSLSSLSDSASAQKVAATIGQTVSTTLAPQFMPSRTVCATVSQSRRLAATDAAVSAARSVGQSQARNFLTNAPGSFSELGAQSAIEKQFQHRCGLYANPDTMQAPSGLCAGAADSEFTDLDIQPWKAILDPITYQDTGSPSDAYGSANTKYRDAGYDAVRMLTDVTPPDALKGPALGRDEGKNLHMLRMRDAARMSLATGVLQDMVAMRTVPDAASSGGTGSDGRRISRLGRYIELLTGKEIDGNSLQGTLPTVMAAGEAENAAVQTITARLATQQGLIFELMRLTEQIVSMEAVELAIKVERSRAGSAATASVPMVH